MNKVSVSVRCTREEYMEFCVRRHKPRAWLTAVGILIIGCGALVAGMDGSISQGVLLLWLLGAIVTLLSPLILPMVRRGEAARRYDASDSLKMAMTLTANENGITVAGATVEGTLPYEAVTEVIETEAMLALVFGSELQLCIPKRSLTQEEQTFLMQQINQQNGEAS